jgi:hypothetical protein
MRTQWDLWLASIVVGPSIDGVHVPGSSHADREPSRRHTAAAVEPPGPMLPAHAALLVCDHWWHGDTTLR